MGSVCSIAEVTRGPLSRGARMPSQVYAAAFTAAYMSHYLYYTCLYFLAHTLLSM